MEINYKDIEMTLRVAARKHVFWTMENKKHFLKSMNFSTTQYMWVDGLKSGVKFNELIFEYLYKNFRNETFLDMGISVGYLQYVNQLKGKPLDIKTIEWDEQLICCEKIREVLDVKVDYVCNDIKSDDFKIPDCEKRDIIILERFFPIYHNYSVEGLEKILKKLSVYANKAIIVESDDNWKEGIFEHLINISERRTRLSGEWQAIVTDLRQFRDEDI